MSLRDKLVKAAGLFIEITPDPAATESPEFSLEDDDATTSTVETKTVEELVKEAPGPNLSEITVPKALDHAPINADGKMDFNALYQQAALPSSTFTAEQMLDMLNTLPGELSIDGKRQTVKATLGSLGKTIGATAETIVADASRKLAALTAYTERLGKQTGDFCATQAAEISTLEAHIAEKRKQIDAARQQHSQVTTMCSAEADRLDDVLEFFSLDVPPSKYAGPVNQTTTKA
ncbi:MAG: hypothetical protein ACYDBB_03570 [Armatimonadota bacterium]